MSARYTWVEPFAGAAAVALRLVGGARLMPPVAWMGGKRRYAREITGILGVPNGSPSKIMLSDAGPWGWVWPLLLEPETSARVCAELRSWLGEHPRDLWDRLAAAPPEEDLCKRAAQWLWIQARSASGVPVWWSGWRLQTGNGKPPSDKGEDLRWPGHRAAKAAWEQASGEGRRPQPVGQRGDRPATQGKTGRKTGRWSMSDHGRGDQGAGQCGGKRVGGMVHPCTIADRVEAIRSAFFGVDWSVRHGDAQELDPQPGFCLLDPPYVGATGYGWDCPRGLVISMAESWCAAGSVVAICEAEPIDIEGWHHVDLTRHGGKAEWLTVSRAPSRLPDRMAQRMLFPPGELRP